MTDEGVSGREDDDLARHFSMVAQAALADRRLSDVDVRVLGVVCKYANTEGFAWPTAVQIGEWVGRNERTVRRSLKRLAVAGYLQWAPDSRRRRRLKVCCGKASPGLLPAHDRRSNAVRSGGRKRTAVSSEGKPGPDSRVQRPPREPDTPDPETGQGCPVPLVSGEEGMVYSAAGVAVERSRDLDGADLSAVARLAQKFPGASLLDDVCLSCGAEAETVDPNNQAWCRLCAPF